MGEQETTPEIQAAGQAKKGKLLMPAVVAGVMVVEGVAIFAAMKVLGGGPHDAPAMQSIEGLDDEQHKKSAEMEVVEFKALNEKSGLTFVVDISVSARVPADRMEEAAQTLAENHATIVDRLTQAVRSAETKHLKEEDLATIRRKMKRELENILGDDGLIEELLITRFQKFRADL